VLALGAVLAVVAGERACDFAVRSVRAAAAGVSGNSVILADGAVYTRAGTRRIQAATNGCYGAFSAGDAGSTRGREFAAGARAAASYCVIPVEVRVVAEGAASVSFARDAIATGELSAWASSACGAAFDFGELAEGAGVAAGGVNA